MGDALDYTKRLDEHADNVAAKLGNDAALVADGGQYLYDTLPRELQRAFVHLALLMQDADDWLSAKLVTAVAEHHRADVGAALCLMGWTPKREPSDLEAHCLELSKQIALGVSFQLELDEPPDLTAVPRR